MRYVVSQDVVYTDVAVGEAVLLDLNTQRYFSINETGMLIWNTASDPVDMSSILHAVTHEYDVDRVSLESLVKAFLERMVSNGLMVELPD